MSEGLSVSEIVQVDVVMTPMAAPTRNFGALLILGASPVIGLEERLRVYQDMASVAQDFGIDAPEYAAAALFFAQSPQPAQLYIGRWARTATSGALYGKSLTAEEQDVRHWTAIKDGAFKIRIDGKSKTLSGIDLSNVTNLNGVASAVEAQWAGSGTVTWNAAAARFELRSATAGAGSTVGFAQPPASGVDLALLLGLTETQAKPIPGVAAESLPDAVQALADYSNDWYGLLVAAPDIESNDHLAVAAFIEASNPSRIYGVTTTDARVLEATNTSDLASLFKAKNFKRTFIQYSSSNPYAAASLYGRAFTVDFNGNRTVITLKFKQEPGVEAETLSARQAATLTTKHCNVFVNYSNDTAIVQQGVMANGYFFDEVHGTDWLQNDVQTAVYTLFYTSATKLAQTDADVNRIVATIVHRLEQAVANGLVAPGIWEADGFGQLRQGQRLSTGYYVYVAPIAAQAKADRHARRAPPIQCAIKLAGAVHSAHVVINVNR